VKKSSRGRGAHLAERGEENREDDTGDGGGSSSTLGKRRRTWGRDRRARPPPAAARISSRRASHVGLRASDGGGKSLLLLSPPLPRPESGSAWRTPDWNFRTARASISRAAFPSCLSCPVAGSLNGRGVGLPRRLSLPQRLPRASASAEALAPLRGRLWPEAKRQPPA